MKKALDNIGYTLYDRQYRGHPLNNKKGYHNMTQTAQAQTSADRAQGTDRGKAIAWYRAQYETAQTAQGADRAAAHDTIAHKIALSAIKRMIKGHTGQTAPEKDKRRLSRPAMDYTGYYIQLYYDCQKKMGDGYDIYSVACVALSDSIAQGTPWDETRKSMYRAISRYVYGHRQAMDSMVHTYVRGYDKDSTEESISMLTILETRGGIDDMETALALRQALDTLPISQRYKQIVRYRIAGYSDTDIAKKMGVSYGAIRNAMSAIRKKVDRATILAMFDTDK